MVGLNPQGQFSDGKLYELAVVGSDEMGALSKLLAILVRHKVNILPSGGYYLLKPGTFVWTTFLDFSKTGSTSDQVTEDLKRLSFVSEVRAKKLYGADFDQFPFPVIHMGNFRSTIFSVVPLLGVERRLIEQFGPSGGVILFEEGRQYLIEAVLQLGKTFSDARPEVFLEKTVGWLRTTGWGLFDFDSSRLAVSGEIRVLIREPPIVEVPGLLLSNFVNGVAAGAIEAVFKRRMRLVSDSYDPKERSLALVFNDMK